MKQDLLALRAQTLLFPVPRVPRVLQAQLVSACKVPRANKVSKVCRVKWVLRACKVPKVQTLLFQAPLAQPEQPVPKVCKALKAPKVFKVSQAQPEQPEQPVLRACKALKVLKVFKVSRAQPVLLELTEQAARKVLQVPQVLTAPTGKTLIQSW